MQKLDITIDPIITDGEFNHGDVMEFMTRLETAIDELNAATGRSGSCQVDVVFHDGGDSASEQERTT